jgi:ankyrin repeat protein
LASLPTTLDGTYERILKDLELADQLDDAIRVLQWLCFSYEPLSLPQVIEILAIQYGDDDGDFIIEERLPDPKDIAIVCSSLISYNVEKDGGDGLSDENGETRDYTDNEDNYVTQVRCAHFSVQEYLLSNRNIIQQHFQKQQCHALVAEGCLHYLLHLSREAPLTREVFYQYPLARYAAEYWWQHAQEADATATSPVSKLGFKLLATDSSTLLLWVQLYNIDIPYYGPTLWKNVSDIAQPLYYAASVGLPEIVKSILQTKVDVNAIQNGLHGTALSTASFHGHDNIVQILLDAGAQPNIKGGKYDYALHAAVATASEKVVKMLLDANADVVTEDVDSENVLQIAARLSSIPSRNERRIRILQMLLNTGVDAKLAAKALNSSLYSAAQKGIKPSVQTLLDAGADPNAPQDNSYSVLATASSEGHEEVVELLLNVGANLYDNENQWSESLLLASQNGHEKVVGKLLQAGANVNAQGGKYTYALIAAAAHKHETVIQLLVNAGLNPNVQDEFVGSALQAVFVDAEPVIELFLKTDRLQIRFQTREARISLLLHLEFGDFKSREDSAFVLHQLSENPYENIIDIFRDAGTNVNEEHASFDKLQEVAMIENLELVGKFCFCEGRKFEVQHTSPQDYLQEFFKMIGYFGYVSESIHLEKLESYEWLTQALLDSGGSTEIGLTPEDINSIDENENQKDLSEGSIRIMQMLLDAGVDIGLQGGVYGSALHAASRFGHKEGVELLLQHGAPVNVLGGEYGSVLQAACSSFTPTEEIVRLLLLAGADVNVIGGVYGTALHAACYRGKKEVVRILLDAGADVNAQIGTYGSPLQAACASSKPDEEIIYMLINRGANISAQGGKFGKAIQAAIAKGYRAAIIWPSPEDENLPLEAEEERHKRLREKFGESPLCLIM